MSQFVDDKLEYIESDIEKIQMKTGMYVSWVGKKGALHLSREIIQNSIDEAENKKSPCKNIDIELDTLSDTLRVEDDGRGIPEDEFPLDIVCTKLQSGSKFTREQGGNSSGENGVGLTACNALASKFSLATFREGKMHEISFEEGIKVDDTRKSSKKEHGTVVRFSPSQKYLGKSAKIPKDELVKWVDSISYLIPEQCKIKLTTMEGTKLKDSYKFKKRPLSDLLKSRIGNDELLTPIFYMNNEATLDEEVRDINGKTKKLKRTLKIEFTFNYTNTLEPYVDSFCNYVNTISGGTHLDAVKEAIWRYFTKKTNEILSDKERDKYKILKVDVEQGLNLIVNMSTDMQMQFVGQTKTTVGNDEMLDPIKKLANDALEKYFTANKEKLANITKIIKTSCKARIEASKVRSAVVKESKDKFDKFKFDKFTPCNNEGKEYKELHLCEGDSAAGSLVDGRDPDTQAFLSFRGMVANAFKRDEGSILDNAEWRTYVTLLKCNFGPKFDLSKLYYDKIIIETDADIDGAGISSGIGAFHALYLPEVVKAGKLYKAYAPLYHIEDKNHPFVRDKREYVEIYQNKIIKNYSIAIISEDPKKKIGKKEFEEFLFDTEFYPEELIRVSKHFGVNKFLVERIASYLTMNYYEPAAPKNHPFEDMQELFQNNDFVLKFVECIQKRFPEMAYKGNQSIRGIIDGKFQSLKINERFIRKISDLIDIYLKYGYSLLVYEKDNSKPIQMSIGEFLDQSSKYKPKIITRYKGLGEATSDQLWDTTLNPDTRILVQMTMEDVERDLAIMRKLHAQTKENLEERKKMMSEFKIKRDDLDN